MLPMENRADHHSSQQLIRRSKEAGGANFDNDWAVTPLCLPGPPSPFCIHDFQPHAIYLVLVQQPHTTRHYKSSSSSLMLGMRPCHKPLPFALFLPLANNTDNQSPLSPTHTSLSENGITQHCHNAENEPQISIRSELVLDCVWSPRETNEAVSDAISIGQPPNNSQVDTYPGQGASTD
ncbi:hypothetical protein LZ30DRAFT_692717 [Colletotrichum cereale]|nr:hypothetical protein LZ30DRAFT_692717 [Colletotrichum cereale]